MTRIIRFTAAWCGPCQTMAKSLEEAQLNVPIEVIDVDTHPELAMDYNIRSVPTLIMFDGNTEMKRTVGLRTTQQLKEWANV